MLAERAECQRLEVDGHAIVACQSHADTVNQDYHLAQNKLFVYTKYQLGGIIRT